MKKRVSTQKKKLTPAGTNWDDWGREIEVGIETTGKQP